MRIHADGNAWDYTPPLRLREAIVMRQALGLTVRDFDEGMASLDPVCWQAMVWVCRSRAGEKDLDPRSIDFDTDTWWIEEPPAAVKGAEEPAAAMNGDRPPVAASAPPARRRGKPPAPSTTPPSAPPSSA